jgi:hypothetical protein
MTPATLESFLATIQKVLDSFAESTNRWEALVSLLVDKGVIATDELEARIRQLKNTDASVLESLKRRPS